jgi:uncharacterized membrane-anchored protein
MDMRAQLQLRLQETVEGFSVVAISYYAFMLLSKVVHGLLEPLAETWHVPLAAVDAGLVIVIIGAVWLGLRTIKKRLVAPKAPIDGRAET